MPGLLIDWTNRADVYLRFWDMLQERSGDRMPLFAHLKPHGRHWLSTFIGRSGVSMTYTLSMQDATVELYIDMGDKQANKAMFDALLAQKEVVEVDFGEPLVWERLDNKRASRVVRQFPGAGLDNFDGWPALQDRMIDAMIRLDRAFRERVAKIEV